MRPDAIGEVFAEPRIVLRGEPIGERDAGIFPFDVGRVAAQEFRGHRAAIEQVFRGRRVRVVVDIELALFGRDLALHAGEEADEAVVIVLRPAVEGMIMALRALHAHAGEDLRDVLRHGLGVVLALRQHGVEIDRGVGEIAAFAGDLRAHELIERDIALDLIVDPLVVFISCLAIGAEGAVVIAAHHQGFGPLGGPQIGEFGAFEQVVDQARALVARVVLEECEIVFGLGRQTDQIEIGAAQKDLVGRNGAWAECAGS